MPLMNNHNTQGMRDAKQGKKPRIEKKRQPWRISQAWKRKQGMIGQRKEEERTQSAATHTGNKGTNPLYMGTLGQRVKGFMGFPLLLSKWAKTYFSSKERVKGLWPNF